VIVAKRHAVKLISISQIVEYRQKTKI
jgi:3,4-dihydroxy-2-butanone 4-phosphate synthase